MKPSILSQLVKETRWALFLTFFYIIGWGGFGYLSPTGKGFLGFPIWFEFSCIYFPFLFIILTILIIKYIFKEINLEVNNES